MFGSEILGDYQLDHASVEGQRVQWPNQCDDNNQDKNACPDKSVSEHVEKSTKKQNINLIFKPKY